MTHKKSLKQNEIVLARGMHLAEASTQPNASQNAQVQKFIDQNLKGQMRVFVAGGSRPGNDQIYIKEAFLLGQAIARMKFRLDFGLSSRGIMGAVAKGMQSAWEHPEKLPIYGVTTKKYLEFEKEDPFLKGIENIIITRTLEERKQQLLEADFVIFAPGGVGTLDELVYDCVAMQDGFLPFKPFILFNVKGFFHHILEYLKSITDTGFADSIPFIVVDDSFEAEIAFKTLPYYYQKGQTKIQSLKAVKNLIHDLPYIIEEKTKNNDKSVSEIIKHIRTLKKNLKKDAHLQSSWNAVEEAYLRKETLRMYDRLAHTGKDVASISDKLTSLKNRLKGL